MKKILIVILAAMLIMVLPIVTFAEEADSAVVEEETVVEENVTPTDEVTAEVEIEPTITETIVEWVKANVEEIAVIFGLIASAFYGTITRRGLHGSIGTLNNNAITIAENSAKSIKDALAEVEGIASIVRGYKEEFATLLGEVRKNCEEKQILEETLNQVQTLLKASKSACIEMSNEVAELLVLANIPNSKKEELYSRHTKAVHELEVVEGVISNDGEKA